MLTDIVLVIIVNNVNYIQGEYMVLEWTDMVGYQQGLKKLVRILFPHGGRSSLTSCEFEILSLIHLNAGKATPLEISRQSGMKKESVSRSLKSLEARGLVSRTVSCVDERRYKLDLTDSGLQELKSGYEDILQPFYDMWREKKEDFEQFLLSAEKLFRGLEE